MSGPVVPSDLQRVIDELDSSQSLSTADAVQLTSSLLSTGRVCIPALLQIIQKQQPEYELHELSEAVLLGLFGVLRRVIAEDGHCRLDEKSFTLQGPQVDDP